MFARYLIFGGAIAAMTIAARAQDFSSPTASDSSDARNDASRVVITGAPFPAYGSETAVTGTKTDTPYLEVPQTVNVVPRQLMNDEATLTIPEALSNIGGVNTGGTYRDYDIYSIRGFFGTGFTYLDGLRVDRQSEFQEEPYGLERVEVVQGPTSVLYGQIPPGGLVNLVSKMPQKTDFTNVTAGGGSFSLAETGVDTNGVLNASGTVYGRINLLWRQYGDFTEHVDPSERLYFAPSLTIELTKHTTLTILGQYYHDWRNIAFPLPAYGTVLPNPNGDINIRRNIGEPDIYPSEADNWRVLFGYQLEHHFADWLTFRQNARVGCHETDFQGLYPSYLDTTAGDPGYYRTLYRFPYENHENYTTLGLDSSLLASFDTGSWAKHTALVGVDYYYQYNITKGYSEFTDLLPIDIYKPVYGQSAIPKLSPFVNTITDAAQTGIYFQDQVKLFDRLSIVGGGRGDFVSNDLTQRIGHTESDASPSAFSPRAGMVYEVVKTQLSTYFSWSRSFESNPGYQTAGGAQVAPEKGEQYEFGAKADLFHGKLSSTLAFYRIERTNVPSTDPTNPFFYVVNGRENHRGIDWNTTANPIKGWDLIAGYGYIDARVTAGDDLGKRPLDVPEHTFNLFTKYTLQDGPWRGLGFGIGYHYQTDMAGDAANSFRLPSYGTLNLSAYYTRGRFSAQLNVNNVTDERFATGAYNNTYVQIGDPVNVRTSVGWKF